MIITIDGPMASGKSSIARLLARELNCYYLYSGLLFRGLAAVLLRDYGYLQEQLSQPTMADIAEILAPENFVYVYDQQQGAQIIYKGASITSLLKTVEIDRAASIIGVHPDVRQALVVLQRRIAVEHALIADGRDCGITVFPHATYKFFLTAMPKIRAERWLAEQLRAGQTLSYEQALAAVIERDARDSSRATSPLQPAPDAFIIDNSDKNLQETSLIFKQLIAST